MTMDSVSALETVELLNQYLMQRAWFDFEMQSYFGGTLIIAGGLDPSLPSREIEIEFDQVFFVSCLADWRTDTSRPPLSMLSGAELYKLNRRFQVTAGHHIFRFAAEDYPDTFGCIVGAQGISYRLTHAT